MRAVLVSALVSLSAGRKILKGKEILNGINYIGTGYDILHGSPQPTLEDGGSDPGFNVLNAVNLTYDLQNTWNGYLIPDQAEVKEIGGCSLEASAKITQGDLDYANYLSTQASVNVNAGDWFAKVAFSASGSFRTFSSLTYTQQSLLVAARGVCPVYSANLRPDFQLNDYFLRDVSELPDSFNPQNGNDPYYQFITKYGQYYASSLVMGSQMVRRFQFEQVGWESLEWMSLDIPNAASTEWGMANGQVSSYTKDEQEQAEKYKEAASSLYVSTIGADPNANGVSDWESDSLNTPYPIDRELSPILDYFTDDLMDSVLSSSEISEKKALLTEAFNSVCEVTENCQAYQDDITAVYTQLSEEGVQKTGSVRCPTGMVALSCGIQTNHSGTVQMWSAFQSAIDECTCHDDYGADCFAVCAPKDVVKNQTLVSKHGYDGFDVSCPDGLFVTGCGLEDDLHGYESYKQVYPSSTTSCRCYDGFGATCHASCAANVKSPRIYQNQGSKDTVFVNCEGEPLVLGCGLGMIYNPPNQEKYPAFWPSGPTQCAGYDYYGATVYALCGNFEVDNNNSTHSSDIKITRVFRGH